MPHGTSVNGEKDAVGNAAIMPCMGSLNSAAGFSQIITRVYCIIVTSIDPMILPCVYDGSPKHTTGLVGNEKDSHFAAATKAPMPAMGSAVRVTSTRFPRAMLAGEYSDPPPVFPKKVAKTC